MLEFSKTILIGVSFDRYLFSKELRKLILWYGQDEEEKADFHDWCIENFGQTYTDIISEAFVKRVN